MVAFLACCPHHSSVGAYVTAAWRIVRRRRSRKKSTNTSRNRMSNVCTKSHAHVTWFRRNVDQLCPSPRGRERGACTAESFACTRGCPAEQLATKPLGTPAWAPPRHLADERGTHRRRSPRPPRATPVLATFWNRADPARGASAS